jgi:2-dehydropantoate 2-reductase
MTAGSGAPIVILGAGAVGSYVGGMLSAEGEDVVLVDAWPGHIAAIQTDGLVVETPEAVITTRPRALHICDVQQLLCESPAVAFLCVKLYDTDWAATLLAGIVKAAPIVTMQNALVEEEVARIAGWRRTLGAIAGTLDVSVVKAGTVRRSRRRGSANPVFKVGELSGKITPRAQSVADLLGKVDTAAVTSRLWDERWGKLVANTVTSGLSAVCGLTLVEVYRREDTRRLAIPLAAEVLAVGQKLGFALQPLFGAAPDRWQAASEGDEKAASEVMAAMSAQTSSMVEGGQSGTLQDLTKGRRTEVDYFNGYVASQGRECGVPTPFHEALATLIRRMERGEEHPSEQNIARLSSPLTR